jgi:hypothetical protein
MVFSCALLNEYLGQATVLRNGLTTVETLTDVEDLEFPKQEMRSLRDVGRH